MSIWPTMTRGPSIPGMNPRREFSASSTQGPKEYQGNPSKDYFNIFQPKWRSAESMHRPTVSTENCAEPPDMPLIWRLPRRGPRRTYKNHFSRPSPFSHSADPRDPGPRHLMSRNQISERGVGIFRSSLYDFLLVSDQSFRDISGIDDEGDELDNPFIIDAMVRNDDGGINPAEYFLGERG